MTSVQVTTKVDLDQLIAGVDQLETSELEAYVAKVSSLLARRKAASLSTGETELLKQINRTLPPDIEERHSVLQEKVHEETLTPAEHAELMNLISIVEQADVERLEALLALSQIRSVSLPALMQQLGITPPPLHA